MNKCILFKKSRLHRTDGIRSKTGEFARNKTHTMSAKQNFSYKDVLDKFGEKTCCYLTGEPINLLDGSYAFDHIIPRSRGGSNDLNNLGVATKRANSAKSDMMLDEFLELCRKVLEYNGYVVVKGK